MRSRAGAAPSTKRSFHFWSIDAPVHPSSTLSSYPPSPTRVNQQDSSLNSSVDRVPTHDKANQLHHPGSSQPTLGSTRNQCVNSTERLGNVSRRLERNPPPARSQQPRVTTRGFARKGTWEVDLRVLFMSLLPSPPPTFPSIMVEAELSGITLLISIPDRWAGDRPRDQIFFDLSWPNSQCETGSCHQYIGNGVPLRIPTPKPSLPLARSVRLHKWFPCII